MEGLACEAMDTFLYQEYEPSLKKFQLLKYTQVHSADRKQQTFRTSRKHVEPQQKLSWLISVGDQKRIIGQAQIVWAIINLIQRNRHIVREKWGHRQTFKNIESTDEGLV